MRFSTVAGNKGSMDLARDVRGFAVKFYTNQGNWDFVGNNIPVFFIRDSIKFADLVRAAKQEPDSDFPQAQTAPEAPGRPQDIVAGTGGGAVLLPQVTVPANGHDGGAAPIQNCRVATPGVKGAIAGHGADGLIWRDLVQQVRR